MSDCREHDKRRVELMSAEAGDVEARDRKHRVVDGSGVRLAVIRHARQVESLPDRARVNLEDVPAGGVGPLDLPPDCTNVWISPPIVDERGVCSKPALVLRDAGIAKNERLNLSIDGDGMTAIRSK